MTAQLSLPLSRATDPYTSRLAGESISPYLGELELLIRAVIDRIGPCTHEEVAEQIQADQPDRWTTGTVVSACSRSFLEQYGESRNRRGRRVLLWVCADVPPADVPLKGNML